MAVVRNSLLRREQALRVTMAEFLQELPQKAVVVAERVASAKRAAPTVLVPEAMVVQVAPMRA